MLKKVNDKVSLIIPFYNCPYIDRAIQSALNQTYDNIEIIVVDDGSTQHVEKITPFTDRIHYIKKGNGGTATALNTGIKNAKGDYFTWLSSDDLYHPDKVKHQLAFMKTNQLMASYTTFCFIDENDQITSEAIGVDGDRKRSETLRMMLRGCFVNGCAVMLAMSVFRDIGVFNDQLLYAHDYDYWLRVFLNYDFHQLNEPLVYSRLHDSMGSRRHALEQYREFRRLKKHYKPLFKKVLRHDNA